MVMIEFIYAAAVLMLVGAFGGLLQTRPIDKILLLAVLGDGLIAIIAIFQYLDVLMISSFMTFVGIVILTIGLIRTREIRGTKEGGIL